MAEAKTERTFKVTLFTGPPITLTGKRIGKEIELTEREVEQVKNFMLETPGAHSFEVQELGGLSQTSLKGEAKFDTPIKEELKLEPPK